MSRDVRLYLEDILEKCDEVIAFTQGFDYDAFVRDRKTVSAVAYDLLAVGEATKHIPDEIRSRYPDVEWQRIAGMRDVLAHAYFAVRESVLWDVVQSDIPVLGTQVQRILAELPHPHG